MSLRIFRPRTKNNFLFYLPNSPSSGLKILIYRFFHLKICIILILFSVQFSSFPQSCPTLDNPVDCSTPRFPVHHQLPELAQTNVHTVSDVIQPFILYCPLLLLPSIIPSIMVFSNELALASSGQSIGASASASVLPMNTQDWSPLGWTGWISLQSKGLSRIFSNTTVPTHQFFGAQLSW